MAALLLGTLAFADEDPPEPSGFYVGGMVGRTEQILGAQDPRFGNGILIGYARPERRFRLADNEAQIAFELYRFVTERKTYGILDPSRTTAAGVLVLARWRWNTGPHWPLYAEIGWGIQYQEPRTKDLAARVNSTPTFGIGFRIIDGVELGTIGVRLIHSSNGGTVGTNQGQNMLFIVGTAHIRT